MFTGFFTISCYNGCEALLWLSEQNPNKVDQFRKYFSEATVFNTRYVRDADPDTDDDTANKLYQQLDDLARGFRDNLKKNLLK